MAMKVFYTVLDGEILHENRAGVKRDYVPGPLGSTVALLDNTQAQTDTFTYWPYGEVKTRTGTTATPFQFVGTLGYYRDSTGRNYVRARVQRTDLTRWQTEDPIGFKGGDWNLYRYVKDNPVTAQDSTGLFNKPCYDACMKEINSGKKPSNYFCKLASLLCMLPGPQKPWACLVDTVCKGAGKITGPGAKGFCFWICRGDPGEARPNACCAPSAANTCVNHCPSLRTCLMCCTAGTLGSEVAVNLCIANCCAPSVYPDRSPRDEDLCDTTRA
jgi:RHS repeat-associated protein